MVKDKYTIRLENALMHLEDIFDQVSGVNLIELDEDLAKFIEQVRENPHGS